VRVVPAPRFEHRHRLAGIRVPIQGCGRRREEPRRACRPSDWRDEMAAFFGRREFITLLGGAAGPAFRPQGICRRPSGPENVPTASECNRATAVYQLR
jgi:hypothetical protein